MGFDNHKTFRDGLPSAPVYNGVYSLAMIEKDARERAAIIATIKNPREIAVQIMGYVETLAPALGAVMGPQGVIIGAAVGKLTTLAKAIVSRGDISPEELASIPGLFGDVVSAFKANRTETDPDAEDDPVDDPVAGAAKAIVAKTAKAAKTSPHHEPDELPPGHTDTTHHKPTHHGND